jgi:hypothetical protein
VVFKLTPGGVFTLVHAFDAGEGSPQSFLQGLDGNFYGTTATLAWRLPAPPITGGAPDAPTGLTAATPPVGLTRVALAWTASSGATSYTVKRGIRARRREHARRRGEVPPLDGCRERVRHALLLRGVGGECRR